MLDKLNKALDSILGVPGAVYDFFTDPIWAVGGSVAGIVLLCVVLAWFFPTLRPIFGAGALGSILYAIGFRKGQKAEDDRNKDETDKLKEQLRAQSQQNQGWWR